MRALTVKGAPRKREYVANRAKRTMTPAERIKHHVQVDGATGCWVWQLVLRSTGYGSLSLNGKMRSAHRVSYETFVGPIPAGLHIDHLCRNRACVNPAHLEPVTCLENVRRSPIGHVAKRCCPQGHAYSDSNTYRAQGRRYCLTCRMVYMAIYRSMTRDQRAARKAAGLPVVDLASYFAEQESAA